jgi:hypothetical protein
VVLRSICAQVLLSLTHTMIVACGALLAMIASSMAFVSYDLPAIGYVLIYAASFGIAIRCYDGMLLSRFRVIKPATAKCI